MQDPKRREQRRTHLDASVVPVERALLARAAVLSGQGIAEPPGPEANVKLMVSEQFLQLAEELHWW